MSLAHPVSRIELSLSPLLYDTRTIRSHHTTVVVDVLRATTALCAAFQAGVEEVVPLNDLESLEHYRQLGYLRAAERGGRKVDAAECGNSPTEYLKMDLHGQRLAYSTTNGTVTILRGGDADRTLVGSFANIGPLCECLLADPQDLVILCSGWKGEFSLEDTLFAGALCHRLLSAGTYATEHDPVHAAIDLWHHCHGNPYAYCLAKASHVRRLQSFGPAAASDILFSFQLDTCNVVPRLCDGVLRCDRQ